MPNSYYNHGAFPATGSSATSASMRAELDLIAAGFDKLPTISGNANHYVVVNGAGNALTTTDTLPLTNVVDSLFTFEDNLNDTKKFQFQASSITAGTTRIYTMPDANTTLVGTTVAQTLTNKTLTLPIISQISNTGTLTLPTTTDTLVGRATTDTLTNKTLTLPVIAQISNVGTLTLPTTTDTLVGRDTTDTLTNKTLTSPVIAQIVNVGTLTLPTSTDTLVGRATTDTLTNKTLTLPVISQISNTGTLTLPTSTDTLVGRATTDTLTNKTISGASNTLSNIGNASLTNSSITIGSTSVSLGGTAATISGLTLSSPTLSAPSISGNLAFTGTGNRITGDYTNATIANRAAFQTSTVNGNTGLVAIPNGTATTATWRAYNSSDPDNAAVAIFGAFLTDIRLSSEITGTGTYLPLTLYAGGSERARIDNTTGNFAIGNTSALQRLTVANTAITGGAPAASGSAADPNAVSRFVSGSVAMDFGGYASGANWIQVRAAGNYTVNYDLVLNPNGGNIGIGTAPSFRLDVAGTGNFTGAVTGVTAAEKTSSTAFATTAFVDRLRGLTTPTTGATGTLVAGDRGALVTATGGVTVPASVFSARDVVSIVNNSAGSITLTQGGGLTMYLAGTATTGNRTLAQRGIATVTFIDATTAVISGGGVS